MKVFQVRSSGEYFSSLKSEISKTERDEIAEGVFHRRSLTSNWKEIEFTQLDPSLPMGDFADSNLLAALPVVFPSAISILDLKTLLSESGELLPCSVNGNTSYLLNVTRVIDAINREQSDLHRMPSGFEMANRPVFDQENLPAKGGFFRVQEAWNRLFLAEPSGGGLKQSFDQNEMTALYFDERLVVGKSISIDESNT